MVCGCIFLERGVIVSLGFRTLAIELLFIIGDNFESSWLILKTCYSWERELEIFEN